jgi:hypothetical protein
MYHCAQLQRNYFKTSIGPIPPMLQNLPVAGPRWLTPVILATQEAEIRKTEVRSQPQANCSRQTLHKNRAGRVAQGEVPEFKNPIPQKKKKSFPVVLSSLR